MDKFVYLPNQSANEYFSISILKHVFSLDIFKSLRKHIASFFKSKQIKDILEFPSMFLGGTPNNTPALYSLMNHADIVGGTWYPMGGMYQVSKGFSKLSTDLGVSHIFNEEINSFEIKNNTIKNAYSKSGKEYKADYYICCSEYPHVQMKLLDAKHRTYNKNYWSKKKIAPSALIFYLGLSKKIKNIDHHNLFFDKDFDTHLDDIFKKKIWPKEPLFYVCCPSKTDISVVPSKEMENLFILIPIGSGLQDSPSIREKYFNNIINRLENITKQSIQNSTIKIYPKQT